MNGILRKHVLAVILFSTLTLAVSSTTATTSIIFQHARADDSGVSCPPDQPPGWSCSVLTSPTRGPVTIICVPGQSPGYVCNGGTEPGCGYGETPPPNNGGSGGSPSGNIG